MSEKEPAAAICNCGHTLLGHVLDGYCLAGHGCFCERICECPAYVPKSDVPAATRRMSDGELQHAIDFGTIGGKNGPALVAETRRAREAEERLRQAIEDGAHDHDCAKIIYWDTRRGSDAAEHMRIYNATPCNCWKESALAPQKKK